MRIGCLPTREKRLVTRLDLQMSNSTRRTPVCGGDLGCPLGLFRPGESTQSNQVLPSLCVWSTTAGVKQSKLESVSCLLSMVKLACTPINFCLGSSGFVFFCWYNSSLAQSSYAELSLSYHLKARWVKREESLPNSLLNDSFLVRDTTLMINKESQLICIMKVSKLNQNGLESEQKPWCFWRSITRLLEQSPVIFATSCTPRQFTCVHC